MSYFKSCFGEGMDDDDDEEEDVSVLQIVRSFGSCMTAGFSSTS